MADAEDVEVEEPPPEKRVRKAATEDEYHAALANPPGRWGRPWGAAARRPGCRTPAGVGEGPSNVSSSGKLRLVCQQSNRMAEALLQRNQTIG